MQLKINKCWQPEKHEDKIYRFWEKSQAFTPKRLLRKTPFAIIMPPPNANGSLHIGHAMFVTIEDLIARYQRMKGKSVLLLPGADHAGILTQVVFEKQLAKKGQNRFNLGRRKFIKECLKFTQNNKKTMYKQIKKLGASCDWKREKFTLDKNISRQVINTFISLYSDGLIYRDHRLINWCPRCMTALSDLEVEHHQVDSHLYFIKYPLVTHSQITGEKRFIIIATTRPETLIGDTAIAVNPQDNRYSKFVGQKICLPIVEREIPVITDESVDPEFGTGVVKITPAHDLNDFIVAQKHNLSKLQIIDFNNKIISDNPQLNGLSILKARKETLKILAKKDLLVNTKRYSHQVGHCERCKTIIQPQISLQWFVNTNAKLTIRDQELKKSLKANKVSLKDFGILAVKRKLTTIIPRHFEKNYFQWVKNLHDWCISRQIWWGHQIPVYYCGTNCLSPLQKIMNPNLIKNKKYKTGCGHIVVSDKKPKKCPKCKNKYLIQDPDVLDTWFSSGQWPYTTLGFPNKPDYRYFYPTSIMETGYEILNIWVLKMIMLGLYRTKKVPFDKIYLHGLVRDAFGEKMSKSKGNVINPLEIIKKFGADALRMSLVVGSTPGNDISLGEAKIKGYRNFANKIWNIARFISLNLPKKQSSFLFYNPNMDGLKKEDKAIIKKLNSLVKTVNNNLEALKFSQAGEAIYHFLWHQLADKYIEKIKNRILTKDVVALAVLVHAFRITIKLLHPFMPYITESIWQKLPRKYKGPLALSSWPQASF